MHEQPLAIRELLESDPWWHTLIRQALQEDVGDGDLTTSVAVPTEQWGEGVFIAKQNLVVCGFDVVEEVFTIVDDSLTLHRPPTSQDGYRASKSEILATVTGSYASMLTAERTALNFLNHLSGIATFTRAFVEQVQGTRACVFDTRKTTPGYRLLEKAAVRAGGGMNHRIGLYDAFLFKDNHLTTGRTIKELVDEVHHRRLKAKFIEVEVETLFQVELAVAAKPDIIMLDNMPPDMVQQARAMIPEEIEVEVSGNVTLQNLRDYAEAGVDRISVGSLTHSAPAADISLEITLKPNK